jgi:hemolysin III
MSYVFLLLAFWQAMHSGEKVTAIISAIVYGTSSIVLYTCSSVYHGLFVGSAKKVMRVIDHCSVYVLICGTYTPYILMCIYPNYPKLAITVMCCIWAISIAGMALTAVSYEKFKKVLIGSYVVLGWGVVLTVKPILEGLTNNWGFWWLLIGGVLYTIGVTLYAIGKKKKWFHSIFHIFVDLASIAMFIGIFKFVLTL